MTETFYRFRGASTATEDDAAVDLGDRRTITLQAECVAVGTEMRADGERRPVISMRVLEVEFGDVTPAPVDDQLPLDAAEDDDL
jgi:hypothetical protein